MSNTFAGRIQLTLQDSFLNAVLTHIAPRTYSVIYSTSPVRSTAEKANSKPTSKHSYSQLFDFDVEDSYPSAMHTDLKRDLRAEIMARANETVTNAPLFETYAFLNPGEFFCPLSHLLCTKYQDWMSLLSSVFIAFVTNVECNRN